MAAHDDELLRALQDLLLQHKFEVGRAIAAHAEWKARLKQCVDEGRCDASATDALRDDRCELGRWLYALPAEARAERAWSLVRDMHANFHREASEIVALVHATRSPAQFGLDLERLIEFGASPRASISLAIAARAHALMQGRAFATPADVKSVALDVMRHRVITSYEAQAEDVDAEQIVQRVLDRIPVP